MKNVKDQFAFGHLSDFFQMGIDDRNMAKLYICVLVCMIVTVVQCHRVAKYLELEQSFHHKEVCTSLSIHRGRFCEGSNC